jgi:hypothetical protein
MRVEVLERVERRRWTQDTKAKGRIVAWYRRQVINIACRNGAAASSSPYLHGLALLCAGCDAAVSRH